MRRVPVAILVCLATLPIVCQPDSRYQVGTIKRRAAELRGVTRQAIALLVRKGRFHTLSIEGETLLMRSEVEEFQPKPTGPTAKENGKRKTRK